MRIGYSRVSTIDQDPKLQIRALEQSRYERIYTEQASGASRKRPELESSSLPDSRITSTPRSVGKRLIEPRGTSFPLSTP